ncbi:MAG: acyl-CoA dehydrogenase family protein [Bowdeniella nasicola]|nr:acyl-CoA dehydrogenase family protein [Bowdeniella nasicola]
MTAILTDELLATIHSRAARTDADNVFFDEDLQDLKEAGYLSAFVPASYGGGGLSLEDIVAEQMRLSGAAPATALAVNMHHIVVGVGRMLDEAGLEGGRLILEDAAAGHLFAFGISEPSNDLVLFGSITDARPDGEGGFTFHGTKIFTSLAPAWTRLLTFGRDDSGESPKSVFAVLHRDDGGFTIREDWDTLGMRATQSQTTILEGAPAPAGQVLCRIDPGPNPHPVVWGIFSHFEILLAACYAGIGKRALEVAVDTVKNRPSVKNQTSYANDPDIRWRLADAAIEMDGVYPQLTLAARDIDKGYDRGPLWMPMVSAIKVRATEAAKNTVEKAIRACGGRSYYNSHELSRLYRDVLAGLFQPSDDESTHAAWANVLLGPIEK